MVIMFLLSALFALFLSFPAAAQETQETKEMIKNAKTHFDNKNFQEAIKLLKSAYEKEELPRLLFNIARAYEEMGDLKNSIMYFEIFAAKTGSEKDKSVALDKIKELKKKVKGALLLEVNVAGAQVMIDDKPAGRTPLGRLELEPREYEITITHPDYETRTFVASVPFGGEVNKEIELEMKKGELLINSNLGSGALELDGVKKVVTFPYLLQAEAGEHVVGISAEGYVPKSEKVYVKPGKMTELSMNLTALKKSGPEAKPLKMPEQVVKKHEVGQPGLGVWPWIVIGGGAAIAGGGAALHILAFNHYNNAKNASPEETADYDSFFDGEYGKAKDFQTAAFVMYGIGAAAVVTGVVLMLINSAGDAAARSDYSDSRAKPTVLVMPALSSDSAGLLGVVSF